MRSHPYLQLVARARPGGGSDAQDIRDLLEESQELCPQMGLTGMQIAIGGRLVKVLEGPEKDVLARMEQISADPRCRDVIVLREGYVRNRRFANWKSAHISDGEEDGIGWLEAERFAMLLSRGLRQAAG